MLRLCMDNDLAVGIEKKKMKGKRNKWYHCKTEGFVFLPQTFKKKLLQILLIPEKYWHLIIQLLLAWNHYWLSAQSQLK